jgi:hypothetical protein
MIETFSTRSLDIEPPSIFLVGYLAKLTQLSSRLVNEANPPSALREFQRMQQGGEVATKEPKILIVNKYNVEEDTSVSRDKIIDLEIVKKTFSSGRDICRAVSAADTPDFRLRRYIPIIDETNEVFVVQPNNPTFRAEVSKIRFGRWKDGVKDTRYVFEFNKETLGSRQFPLPDAVNNHPWSELDQQLTGLSMPARLRFFMGRLCDPDYTEYLGEISELELLSDFETTHEAAV